MFIGHYSASYLLKKVEPRVPIFPLLIASQFLDYLFMVFILIGVENMRIEPGFTAVNAFVLFYMPYSHSMVGAILWGIAFGLLCAVFLKGKTSLKIGKIVLICGLGVFSHYVLDVLVHTPDMPLFTNDSMKLGLGLWNSKLATIAIETVFLTIGWILYIRESKPGEGFAGKYGASIFFCFLLFAILVTPFSPPPKSFLELSAQALVMYTIIALLGAWVDKKRVYPQK